jgi:hypothetical protein
MVDGATALSRRRLPRFKGVRIQIMISGTARRYR